MISKNKKFNDITLFVIYLNIKYIKILKKINNIPRTQ